MKLYQRVIIIFFVIGLVFGTPSCSNNLGEVSASPSGSISGHAYYSNSDDSSGIIVTLEKTDGLHSLSVIESSKTKIITDNSRYLAGTSSVKSDGSYIFKNLEDGIYTVYASSAISTEKAVSINNAVITGGKSVIVDDLQLTATGSISGKITLDDSTSESYGFLVYIAGTSYSAMTDIDGSFIITNIPAKSNYSLIVQKGNFTYFWKNDVKVTSNNETTLSDVLQFTSAYINKFISGPNGKDGTSIVWKGSYESENDFISKNGNAQYLWAYYNTVDECSYIYNGTEWTLLAGVPSREKYLYNSFKIGETECIKTGEVAVITSREGSKTITGLGSEGVFISGRKVTLSPYAIGKYEVTQQLFQAVMGTNPSECTTDVTGEDSLLKPVDCSWYDAIAFCNKLSILNNLEPVYSVEGISDWSSFEFADIPKYTDIKWESAIIDISKNGFRLPTEAEWEYAARGANPNAEEWNYTYAGSNDASLVAWYESETTTHEVGLKSPNSIGLYDMSGNAYEWCSDLYKTPVETGSVTDPINLMTGNCRVQKGGCFKDSIVPVTKLRSDACGGGPAAHWNDWGFRICRNLTPRTSTCISHKKVYYIGINGYESIMDLYSENSLYTNKYTTVLDVSSSSTFYVKDVSEKLDYVKYDDFSDAYITIEADNSFTVNNKTETKIAVNIYVTKEGKVTVSVSIKKESVILSHRIGLTIETPAFEASDKEEYSGMFKCIIPPRTASYDYISFGDDYFKYEINETDFSSQVELNPYNSNGDECVVTNSSAINYLIETIYFNIEAKTYTIYLKEGDVHTVNVSNGSWYYCDLNIEDNNLDVMIIINDGVLQSNDLICSPRTGLAYYDCSLSSSKVDIAGSSRIDLPTESFTDGNNLRIYVYCNTAPNVYMWYKNADSVESWPGKTMTKFVGESD